MYLTKPSLRGRSKMKRCGENGPTENTNQQDTPQCLVCACARDVCARVSVCASMYVVCVKVCFVKRSEDKKFTHPLSV